MKICVTAGPTREFIDPVRFISSPSSGKMGYFLAQEMLKQGHEVTLISGPVSLKKPTGIIVKYVQTAKEMRDQVVKGIANFDVLVMTAAVCDYSLPEIHTNKIKKNDSELVLSLVENPDILKEVSKVDHDAYVVGFAAESEDLIENARKKMFEKKLNMIVANDITQKETGFASDDFEGFILRSDGSLENIAKCSKSIASKCILKAICEDICES